MGIGFRELLIILVIALVLFGAKKLKNVGSDLGSAVRGFKKAMSDGEDEQAKQLTDQNTTHQGRGLPGEPCDQVGQQAGLTGCSRSASPRSS